MKRCIICGQKLTEENNSREHIIPKRIGGINPHKDIICKACNNLMGSVIDKPFLNNFQHMYDMSGNKSGRVIMTLEQNNNLYRVPFSNGQIDNGKMIKWQGFYLSDHTAALNQQNQRLNAVYVPRPQQSLAVITEVLADAYQRQQPVTIQLKTVDQNNRHLPDITTLIRGYNANDIVIDADQFIPLQEIRNVADKKTEKL